MAFEKHGAADPSSLLRIQETINQAVCDGQNRTALAESLTRACREFLKFDCAWLWTCEPRADQWRLESLAGGAGVIKHVLGSFNSNTMVATHLRLGQAVAQGWTEIWPEASAVFQRSGFQQVVVLPLKSGNKLVGAFGFASSSPEEYDKRFLGSIGQTLNFFAQCLEVLELNNSLAQSQLNMDGVFAALDDPLIIVDSDGRILDSNLSSVGIEDRDEGLDALLPGGIQFLNKCRGHGPTHVTGNISNQSRLIKNDGHLMPVEVLIKEGIWQGQMAFFLTCRDITRRQVVEKERERLETAIEQTADSILITNSSGFIQYTNPAFSKLTGYSAKEVLGANPRILKSSKHDESFYRQMWSTIRRGETWKGRMINRKKSGEEYWEVTSISPVRDSSGIITHFVGVKHDITSELKLEERLRQGQKLEAIGALAGGIAHDFNNILYALLGNSQLAMDDIPEDHPAHLPMTEIIKAGDRGTALVAKMMTFGQRAEREMNICPLGPILTEVMDLTRASLPTTIDIKLDLAEDCPEILLDEGQIHQVVLNLCTNAAHAMRSGGGLLKLQLKPVSIKEDTPEDILGVLPGEYLCLKVSDTGKGMDADVLSRIFEPYYTTKKPDEGTGLGLASVHGIVRNHEGRIFVDSTPNEGSCFTMFFPVAAQPSVPVALDTRAEVSAPDQSQHLGRVMIVDDELMIINVVERGLQKRGFEVTGFTDGREALKVFKENPDAFDVVITDQTMPGITGFELAAILSSIRPELPIILSTGYSKESLENELQDTGVSHFLSKPLRIKELSDLLCEINNQAIPIKGA